MTSAHIQIEEQLLQEHRLSSEQLQVALALSRTTPCSLEQALWRLNLIHPEAFLDLVARVTEQTTLKQWLEEPQHQIDLALADLLQSSELRQLGCFPCAQVGGALVVAVQDLENAAALDAVWRAYPGVDVQFVLATQNQIDALVVESGLERGLTSQRFSAMQWQEALSTSRYTGATIGQTLTSLGYLRGIDYISIVSELLGLSLLFPQAGTESLPAGDLVRQFDLTTMLRHQFIPHGWLDAETLMVVVQDPLDIAVEALLYAQFPGVQLVKILGTERDITQLIDRFYNRQLSWQATYQLFAYSPEESAAQVFTLPQVLILYAIFILVLWRLVSDWWGTLAILMAILNLFFVASIGFKLILSLVGASDRLYRVTDAEVMALDDRVLPLYTILIPVYREAEVLPILIQALAQLDYPKERLDVLLLFETDDTETVEAAKALSPPNYIRFIYVPDSQPKTKPKALNYALSFARGEYLTIYDAEDIPEPDQLKKAIIAFKNASSDLICVQAALNYFNYDENLLTRMFTLEYSYWFDYIVPGLQTLRCPIPLGGTSNHFRIDRLRELGGWDPFNVTEDADLGIRASERGYRIGVINSTTFEEANCELDNWVRQRSRWLKGYMQTWLVHTRYPIRSIQRLGIRKWAAVQLFVGGTILSFITTPILWVIFCYWLITRAPWLDNLYPEWVLYLSLFNLIFANALGVYLNMIAVFRRRYYKLIFYSLLNPLYWLLHSVAGYLAIWQLYSRTFYWEKTRHGLSHMTQQRNP